MSIKPWDKYQPYALLPSAQYPYGGLKQESALGVGDGSPLDVDWGNDFEAFKQTAFSRSGLTPSGNADTVTNSEMFNAMQDTVSRDIWKRLAAELGYNLVTGSFEEGATLESSTECLWYKAENNIYIWKGTYPKTVPDKSTPVTSGGVSSSGWVLVGDMSLRGDLAAASGADIVGFQQAGAGSVHRTAQDKMREHVSVKDFGAVGNGIAIDGGLIQAALNSGAKSVYAPAGTFLLDHDLEVPAGVELYGAGQGKTIFRMVGHDTHGRNSALFAKYESIAISAAPAMVVLLGSNSSAHDFTCDGNGFNNYDLNAGVKDYLNETTKHGYCAARIGRLTNRVGAGKPASFIENSHIYRVTATLTAWGAMLIVGFGYRFYTGLVTTDEDLIGAKYCTIKDCTTVNTFSNNIALFSAKDCQVIGNTVINNVHKGIACYVRCRDILIEGNAFIYDETTDVSWRDGKSVTYNREAELGTRSDAIAIGHSDYDTLIRNIAVVGNKLRGNGKIRNGVTIYSDVSQVEISGNVISGFISPLAIGTCHLLNVSANTLRGNSYTQVEFNPGRDMFGSDVQFSARGIEDTKARPAPVCVMSFTANLFEGTGTNHVRGNDWTGWNAHDAGLQAHFSGNTYANTELTSIGAEAVKPINLNTRPLSANPSSIVFEGDKHYSASGLLVAGDSIFFSDQMWAFVLPYGFDFFFTPSVIGGTVAGAATYTKTPKGIYRVAHGYLEFSMEAGWSAHTGTGNLRITGLPVQSRSTTDNNVPATLGCHFSTLTFSGQVTAAILNGASTVDFFGLTTGGEITNVPLDTAVNVMRVSGGYFI